MSYPRILSAFRSARWAITPSALQGIADTLSAHMRGRVVTSAFKRRGMPEDTMPGDGPGNSMPSNVPHMEPDDDDPQNVAVIPVYGIIGKHLSSLETMCGGVDVDEIWENIEGALRDPAISAIILDIDSPGGVVTGVPEIAHRIRNAGSQKPIYAFTDSTCCSAAYWIASACAGVFCTVSADLGSIGVYVAMCDDSQWWQNEGYKLELIKAGQYKAAGISGKSLTDEERAMIQSDVDAIYAMFTSDVRAGRGIVDDSTMQGQTFMGVRAVGVNLADEMVESLDALKATVAASVRMPM